MYITNNLTVTVQEIIFNNKTEDPKKLFVENDCKIQTNHAINYGIVFWSASGL